MVNRPSAPAVTSGGEMPTLPRDWSGRSPTRIDIGEGGRSRSPSKRIAPVRVRAGANKRLTPDTRSPSTATWAEAHATGAFARARSVYWPGETPASKNDPSGAVVVV